MAANKKHRTETPDFEPLAMALSAAPSDAPVSEPFATEGRSEGGRLSRHIPNREQMDYDLASYNLCHVDGGSSTDFSAFRTGASGVSGVGGGGSHAFSDSFDGDENVDMLVSKDAVYKGMLQRKLPGGGAKIGDQVLKFGTERALNNGNGSAPGSHHGSRSVSPVPSAASSVARDDSGVEPAPGALGQMPSRNGGTRAPVRHVHSNPERVLDAPGLLPTAAQALDWGTNDVLMIGLGNVLYTWHAKTASSERTLELQEGLSIRNVAWLHNSTCAAVTVNDGKTCLIDLTKQKFLRQIQTPCKTSTQLAVSGPILATGSERGSVYVYDMRASSPLVSTFEGGHPGSARCISDCKEEPYDLASGGADGNVCVWDRRNPQAPRYGYKRIVPLDASNASANSAVSSFAGGGPVSADDGVTALAWDNDRRSRFYVAGGRRHLLRLVNTPHSRLSPLLQHNNKSAANKYSQPIPAANLPATNLHPSYSTVVDVLAPVRLSNITRNCATQFDNDGKLWMFQGYDVMSQFGTSTYFFGATVQWNHRLCLTGDVMDTSDTGLTIAYAGAPTCWLAITTWNSLNWYKAKFETLYFTTGTATRATSRARRSATPLHRSFSSFRSPTCTRIARWSTTFLHLSCQRPRAT